MYIYAQYILTICYVCVFQNVKMVILAGTVTTRVNVGETRFVTR